MLLTTTNVKQYPLTLGVVASYNIPFKYFEKNEIYVQLSYDDMPPDQLVIGVDYTLSDAGDAGTLYVIPNRWDPEAVLLTISRILPGIQGDDIMNGGKYDADVLEAMIDKSFAYTQQLEEQLSRAVKIDIDDELSVNLFIPKLALRLGKIAAYDSNGKPTVVAGLTSYPLTTWAVGFNESLTTAEAQLYMNVRDKDDPINAATLGGASLSTDITLAANSDALIPSQKAIKTYVDENSSAGIPLAGSMDWNQGTLPPDGFAWRNGDILLRASYPDLWIIAQDNLGSDYGQFGIGNGSTTFTLPDDTLFDSDGWDLVYDVPNNAAAIPWSWGLGKFLIYGDYGASESWGVSFVLEDLAVNTKSSPVYHTVDARVYYNEVAETIDNIYSAYFINKIYKWNSDLASGRKKIMKISGGVSSPDTTALEARMLALENTFSVSEPYETVWIYRTDWTNVHLGSTQTLNVDSNVTHGRGVPRSKLSIEVLLSFTGSDDDCFDAIAANYSDQTSGIVAFGYRTSNIDNNNIQIQTGLAGIAYILDNGVMASLQTTPCYYKLKVTANQTKTFINASSLTANPRFVVEDQKPSGTNGGTFTAGAYRTRVLTTVVTNTIGAQASLSGNQITLPAGTYVPYIKAPSYTVNHNMLKIYDITHSVDLGLWSQSSHSAAAGAVWSNAEISNTEFTLSEETILEIQHICQTTKTGTGFGEAVGIYVTADHETYTTASFEKIG